MGKLTNIEPKDVFYYFEEISKIPHGSGNTRQISDYLAAFAKSRGLEHYQDEVGNVIIIKEAAAGYEDHEPVILQGHMDMVAVKEPQASIDMTKEGLELEVAGDWIRAKGTSLGGDDGIAVAYGLALLAGDYPHPRIEVVVTVDEEAGMEGARVLDVSPLKGRRMINIDTEEEGFFIAGCAGGMRAHLRLSGERKQESGILCKLKIYGLQGGHSGTEIHKERGNAICLLGRTLAGLQEKLDFSIVSLKGGVADNAIPTDAEAAFLVTGYRSARGQAVFGKEPFSPQECRIVASMACEKLQKELQEELAQKDSQVRLEMQQGETQQEMALSGEQTGRLIALLAALPNGVQAMNMLVPGLVETSLNVGIVSMEQGNVKIEISVRSSVESAKYAMIQKLKSLASLAGAELETGGDYPGWNYREISPLRELLRDVYWELYQREPVIEAIHAGLECGLLMHKLPELDCISIGPDMKKIHTWEEELSISSSARVWTYLLTLLKRM